MTDCCASCDCVDADDVAAFSRRNFRWPSTAAELNAATGGYGTWASAWLCDEASGSLADSIGSITLTQGNSPTYRNPGAINGSIADYAVGFDLDQNDLFRAGSAATYDLDGTTSLAIYICLYSTAAGAAKVIGAKFAPASPYYFLDCQNASGHLRIQVSDNAGHSASASLAANHCNSVYHDVMFFIDRTAQVVQVVSDLGASVTGDITAVTTLSNADFFTIGGHELDSSLGHTVAYAAVATGDIVNLRANASAAIANIRKFTGR